MGCGINENSSNGLEMKVLENEIRSNKKELSPKQLKTKGLVWIPVHELSGSMVKPQLSDFLKSIFQLTEFEEFVNSVPMNPEIFEIAKHFEAQKWISSPPIKRFRESNFYYNTPYRRRLNDSREYPPRGRDLNRHHFPNAGQFYPSWGRNYYYYP